MCFIPKTFTCVYKLKYTLSSSSYFRRSGLMQWALIYLELTFMQGETCFILFLFMVKYSFWESFVFSQVNIFGMFVKHKIIIVGSLYVGVINSTPLICVSFLWHHHAFLKLLWHYSTISKQICSYLPQYNLIKSLGFSLPFISPYSVFFFLEQGNIFMYIENVPVILIGFLEQVDCLE